MDALPAIPVTFSSGPGTAATFWNCASHHFKVNNKSVNLGFMIFQCGKNNSSMTEIKLLKQIGVKIPVAL